MLEQLLHQARQEVCRGLLIASRVLAVDVCVNCVRYLTLAIEVVDNYRSNNFREQLSPNREPCKLLVPTRV